MELKHKDILENIASTGDLSEDTISALKKILDDFTTSFKVSVK
jgi:hypothetical protein